MKCHVLGHVQPCKASFCAEIEREHQAVRRAAIEECVAACHEEIASYDTGTSPYFTRGAVGCIGRITSLLAPGLAPSKEIK